MGILVTYAGINILCFSVAGRAEDFVRGSVSNAPFAPGGEASSASEAAARARWRARVPLPRLHLEH